MREYSESELIDMLQRHFPNLSVFYQSNVRRDNWINIVVDNFHSKLRLNLRHLKHRIPNGLIRSIRRVLRAERTRTIASDITDIHPTNASVMIVRCTLDEPIVDV